MIGRDRRCPAAHPADPRPCDGPDDSVEIVDQTGVRTPACGLHGAVLLASLEHGRVYPLNGPKGSAITLFTRARSLPAFDFLTGPGVAKVATAEEAAVFPYGVDAPRAVSSCREGIEDRRRQGEDSQPSGAGLCWPGAGNARSSCLIETVTGARGNA